MKLRFNPYGFIVCVQFHADGWIEHRRFDTKKAALNWVREDAEMRCVTAECWSE
jgi:hypothetical protein